MIQAAGDFIHPFVAFLLSSAENDAPYPAQLSVPRIY